MKVNRCSALVPARILLGVCVLGVLLGAARVEAQPAGFAERWRASFMGGLSVSHFEVGELGARSGEGIGLSFSQFVQKGYWGFGLRVATAYHLSSQADLPFDQGFIAYELGLDGRSQIPLWEGLMLPIKLEVAYVGLASNALVEVEGVGNAKGLLAVGLGTGLQYITGAFIAELVVQAQYLPISTEGNVVNSVKMTYLMSAGFTGLW